MLLLLFTRVKNNILFFLSMVDGKLRLTLALSVACRFRDCWGYGTLYLSQLIKVYKLDLFAFKVLKYLLALFNI